MKRTTTTARKQKRTTLTAAGKEVDSTLTPFETKKENAANILANTGVNPRYSGKTGKFYV
jgi:hypothetical protein